MIRVNKLCTVHVHARLIVMIKAIGRGLSGWEMIGIIVGGGVE